MLSRRLVRVSARDWSHDASNERARHAGNNSGTPAAGEFPTCVHVGRYTDQRSRCNIHGKPRVAFTNFSSTPAMVAVAPLSASMAPSRFSFPPRLDSTRPDDFRGNVAQVVYEGPGDDSRSTGSILASERGGSPRESGKTVCVCAERSLGRPLFADLAPMNHSGPGVCGRQNKEPRKKEPVRPTTRPGRKFRARLPFLSRRNSPPFSAFFR